MASMHAGHAVYYCGMHVVMRFYVCAPRYQLQGFYVFIIFFIVRNSFLVRLYLYFLEVFNNVQA